MLMAESLVALGQLFGHNASNTECGVLFCDGSDVLELERFGCERGSDVIDEFLRNLLLSAVCW